MLSCDKRSKLPVVKLFHWTMLLRALLRGLSSIKIIQQHVGINERAGQFIQLHEWNQQQPQHRLDSFAHTGSKALAGSFQCR